MKDLELSIIVPVFNGQTYIEKTINNLLKIEIDNYEIIIINDGSSDNTENILELKYSNNDKINIVNLKENKGVSYCRNFGISKARGQYITFMDVDDEVNTKMYIDLLTIAKKDNLDVCGCNYIERSENVEVKSKYILPEGVLNNDEIVKLYLTDKISPAIWDKIFKYDILEKVKFNEKLQVGEDILFCLEVFLKTEKARFINEYYYCYMQQETSVMHQISNKLVQFKEIEKGLNVEDYNCLRNNYSIEFEYFRGAMIMRGVHSISMLKNKYNKKQAIDLIYNIMDRNILKNFIKNKYTAKNIKIEVFILIYLGIRMHLSLMPMYKYIRNKIRK